MGYIDWLSKDELKRRKAETLKKFDNNNHKSVVTESSEDRNARYYSKTLNETKKEINDREIQRIKENQRIADESSTLYRTLITECFMKIFNKSMDYSEDQYDANIARAFIDDYIKNEGTKYILGKMKTASSVLSEMAFYVEETCKGKCDEDDLEAIEVENERKFKIDPETKDEFFDKLDNTIDIDDVSQSIQLRVSNAMSEFINNNAQKKAEIDDTINQIKDKIEGDTSEEVKEAFQLQANRRIEQINNSGTVNLFEKMIENLANSVYTNPDANRRFCENGKINMDKVIQHVKTIYSVLEIFNTTRLETFNADKIQEIVESFIIK